MEWTAADDDPEWGRPSVTSAAGASFAASSSWADSEGQLSRAALARLSSLSSDWRFSSAKCASWLDAGAGEAAAYQRPSGPKRSFPGTAADAAANLDLTAGGPPTPSTSPRWLGGSHGRSRAEAFPGRFGGTPAAIKALRASGQEPSSARRRLPTPH